MSSVMQEAMKYLPIGFRFHPTEEELLSHYLRRKNLGLDEPDCAIPDVDLCGWEPEELRAEFKSSILQSKNHEWWFFSEQKPGRTQNRSTRGGYWKKTGQTRDIKSRNGTKQVIGSKKILTFFRGNNSNSTKTDWVMHEYLLASDALDAFFGVNRKNYVVCMLKCNSDCELEEPMAIDITDILEAEADNVFIPEDLVQATMRSLEPLCRNESVNPNLSRQFPHRSNYSADSSRTQFSLGRDSIELDSPFYGSEDDSLSDILNQVFVDTGDVCEMQCSSNRTRASDRLTMPNGYVLEEDFGDLGDNVFETARPHQQQTVIMENKQTTKVESLHGFVPLNEKKGIIEDDSTQSTASTFRTKTPKARSDKELPQIMTISYLPSEAKARRHAPPKIKEEIVSAGSSSTSTCKPREVATAIQLEGNKNSANTTKVKEINMMAALSDHKKPAREHKLMTAQAKPISCSLSDNSRKCTDVVPSLVYIRNLVVGIILCIAIFCEIFGQGASAEFGFVGQAGVESRTPDQIELPNLEHSDSTGGALFGKEAAKDAGIGAYDDGFGLMDLGFPGQEWNWDILSDL